MIIYITKSRLFTEDPASRFAREHGVDPRIWQEMWKRHRLLEYSLKDLADYFQIKTGRKANSRSIQRWLDRSYIYEIAHTKSLLGAQALTTEAFGEYAPIVVEEITKHLKTGGTKDNRSIV